jgi:hypothetical protein
VKYEDYLQEHKKKRQSLDAFRTPSDKPIEIRELKQIMRTSQSEKDKLYRAKLVA